jgi:hypothetical protein
MPVVLAADIVMAVLGAVFAPTVAAITVGPVTREALAARLGRNAACDRAGDIFAAAAAGLAGWAFSIVAVFHLVPLFAALNAGGARSRPGCRHRSRPARRHRCGDSGPRRAGVPSRPGGRGRSRPVADRAWWTESTALITVNGRDPARAAAGKAVKLKPPWLPDASPVPTVSSACRRPRQQAARSGRAAEDCWTWAVA